MPNKEKRTRKPRLGQHFLTSTAALAAMRDASDIQTEDIILEIGPGKGILTDMLLTLSAKVMAVEKDRSLVEYLQEKFKTEVALDKLNLLEQDILNFDPNILHVPYKVVANIPYYITGEIIRMFLTADHKPISMTLLVQKEVAERIVARDNKESVLSLSVKYFGTPTYVQTVKRGSFSPPPSVDSAIIHIANITERKDVSEEKFFQLVKAGFKSKRKKLISNLSSVVDKEKLTEIFSELSLDENVRAEDVNLDQWLSISVNR